ncbi:MAG: hypothetical protein IIB38_11580 [Candidatus Hydrogenedentes bacterium]|nr:hypothetical protein [Candidatus Hydrogenedentota bacterium]
MNEEEFSEICPLCGAEANFTSVAPADSLMLNCKNFGRYEVVRTVKATDFESKLSTSDRAKLSYAIRREQTSVDEYEAGKTATYSGPLLGTDSIKDVIQSTELPKPPEQMKMMVRWIGDTQPSPGKTVPLSYFNDRARFGAIDKETVEFIITSLTNRKLTEILSPTAWGSHVKLTAKGWELYEELKTSSDTTREVFMAMGYGSVAADKAFKRFQVAVSETGFSLWRLDERPEAGLIDARMIVAIQNAKFVIADLTDQNRGAYWEAGTGRPGGPPGCHLGRGGAGCKLTNRTSATTSHAGYCICDTHTPPISGTSGWTS